MRGKQLGVVLFNNKSFSNPPETNPHNRPTRPINVGATAREDRQRTGLRTRVVENVVEEVVDSRVLSRSLIPFVRPRNVIFTGDGFKPKTRVYVFFDGVAVSQFCTPTSSAFSLVDSPIAGSPLVTDSSGAISGTFAIPEHRFPGQENNPRFRTGEVAFRITSSEDNTIQTTRNTR